MKTAGEQWKNVDPSDAPRAVRAVIEGQAMSMRLHSRWIEANVGYAIVQWLRLEGFYAGSHQTVDRPGGLVDRNRIGVQLITSSPLRIR